MRETRTKSDPAAETQAADAGAADAGVSKAPPYVQVHIQGEYFSVEGGDAPSVYWQPDADDTKVSKDSAEKKVEDKDNKPTLTPVQCRNVLLLSPGELFCTLPVDKYKEKGHFTVVRAGEQPPQKAPPTETTAAEAKAAEAKAPAKAVKPKTAGPATKR